MGITGLHIPHGVGALAPVTVNERDAMGYYPYVQGGPVEAAYLTIRGHDLVIYVNSRYPDLDMELFNPRAAAMFELAGLGAWGETVRGDALLVRGAGDGEYERSLSPDLLAMFMEADSGGSPGTGEVSVSMDWDTLHRRLLQELPRALRDLSVGGLDLPDSRYVQWAGHPEGLHIEVVGNEYLDEPLSFSERRALQLQSWQPPEPPDWPNFFRQFTHPVALGDAAAALVDGAKILVGDLGRAHANYAVPTVGEPAGLLDPPLLFDDPSVQRSLFDEADGAGADAQGRGLRSTAEGLGDRCGDDEDDPWAGLLESDSDEEAGENGDDEDEDWEPLDEFEVMGDLSDLLGSLPTVWTGTGEREFMVYAWSALKAADAVPCTTPREHLRAVATLGALHLLRVSFYVHSRDEGIYGVERWDPADLMGDYPATHPYWLGVELATAFTDYDIDQAPDSVDLDVELKDTWTWLVRRQYAAVKQTLLDVWGDNELFCALWTSSAPEPRFPVPGHVMNEILNGDGTLEGLADRMPAWEWMTNGMRAAH